MIRVSTGNLDLSSPVSTIQIDSSTANDLWVIPLEPAPDTDRAIIGISVYATWSAYNTITESTESGSITYGAGAEAIPCPATYSEDITYRAIRDAGGIKYSDRINISPHGGAGHRPPFGTSGIFRDEAAYKTIIKSGCFVISGDNMGRSDVDATISNVSTGYSYVEAIPYATQQSPAAGIIDEKADNKFSWNIGFDNVVNSSLTQKSAKFEWKLKDEPDENIHVIELGTEMSYILPANTIKDKDIILWRVTLTSSRNITGKPSNWIELGTQETEPSKCKPISPNGIYVDGGSEITFRWEHISSIGSKSTGYDLDIKQENEWIPMKSERQTPATFARISGKGLQAGINYWRVRSYNSDGITGYWSDTTAFYVVARPNAPQISSVESGKPRPLVTWNSKGQVGYQLQVLQGNLIVYDSGMSAGTATQVKVKDYLDDGSYTFRVRIQNEFNKVSPWGEYKHTIKTVKPEKPTFVGTVIPDVGALLTLTYTPKPGEKVLVKRNGKIIGEITTTFTDYAALGTSTYSVIVVDTNDCFNESDKLTLTYTIKDTQLSLVSDMKQTLHLNQIEKPDRPLRSGNCSFDIAENKFAGRKYPVVDQSEHLDETITLNFIYSNLADFDNLVNLLNKKETLLYRDKTGERFYCTCAALSYQEFNYYIKFTLTLKRVDFAI